MALYSSGPKDLCVIFFYFLISIVIHAVVQEYIIDVCDEFIFFLLKMTIDYIYSKNIENQSKIASFQNKTFEI